MMRKRKALVALLCLVSLGSLLWGSVPVFANGNSPGNGKSGLQQAREQLEQRLIGVPGFAGIADSEETGQIVVFLDNAQAKGNVPDSFGGFAVRKQVTGPFKALGTQVLDAPAVSQPAQEIISRVGAVSPLVGGVSVSALAGSLYIYAGTLGMVTYDNKILSNAHVLAMNPDDNSFLTPGTPVVQPGTLDGGFNSSNEVGQLEDYIPITFSKGFRPVVNYADAAIASIDSGIPATAGEELGADDTSTYPVSGTTDVSAGDTVEKSGRTSGVTENTVAYTNASTWVSYGSGKRAYFADQIMVNQPFISSGDSGSCVSTGGKFVGLAFAAGGSYAVVCKASYIISGLGISVAPVAGNFSVNASPTTLNFSSGGSASFDISVTPSGGFNGTVDLTAESSSANLTVAPQGSSSVGPDYSSTVTFNVSSQTAGTYAVTVTGTCGALSSTATVPVTVSASSPSSQLSVSVSRGKGSYKAGQPVPITVTVTSSGSIVQGATVEISVIGPSPSNNTVFTYSGTTDSTGTTQCTWSTSKADTAPGTYTVQASASGDGYTPGLGSATLKIR